MTRTLYDAARALEQAWGTGRNIAPEMNALREACEGCTPATLDEVTHARTLYQREGEVEVDDDAAASRGDDDGCYVAAWVWVPNTAGEEV